MRLIHSDRFLYPPFTNYCRVDISIKPKVHIFEDHAVSQIRYHWGIGDKGEDFAEESYPNRKCKHRKETHCAQKINCINNDPAIQDLLIAVINNNRRKLTREISLMKCGTPKKTAWDDGRHYLC